MLDEVLLMDEMECGACRREPTSDDAEAYQYQTDGTEATSMYCSDHIPSYLSVCIECCGVYTANPGGVCQYCLGTAND
jgi:hypothetical protein